MANISTTITAQTSYSDVSMIGADITNMLVFVGGNEFTTEPTASFNSTTGTFSFGSSQTGRLKIILL